MAKWHEDSLRLTNAVIGLTRPDEAWQSPLADLGYRVLWLERRLNSKAGGCQPDIIVSCADANHSILVEVKCGSLQDAQHSAYLALTKPDLTDGGIPDTRSAPFTFDVAYATSITFSDIIKRGFIESGLLPLLVFDDELIRGEGAAFSSEGVEALFGGGVDIAGLTPPMGYVVFNDDSSDLEVMYALLPAMLASLRQGDAQLTTEELIRATMPYWESFAQQYKTALRQRVERLVSRQARCFAEFFDYVGSDVPHRLVMKTDLSRVVGRGMFDMIGRWDAACAGCLTDLGALAGQLPLFE